MHELHPAWLSLMRDHLESLFAKISTTLQPPDLERKIVTARLAWLLREILIF